MALTLKAARVNRNLKATTAAKALGISADTLCRYEKGQNSPPVKIVQKMLVLYGVCFEDLVFDEP